MWRRLLECIGLGRSTAPPPAARAPAARAAVSGVCLAPEAARFLGALCGDPEYLSLQELGPDDRAFISHLMRKNREQRFEVPMLPRAAVRISRLLGTPDRDLDDYAEAFVEDPALSVEVLRLANSAYYGFATPARSVREAILRLGLGTVRGMVVMAHLQHKVLGGGECRNEAGWLSDLSLVMSRVGTALAPALGASKDDLTTWCLLHHLEHFVILGAVSELARERRRRVRPSEKGLGEAFLAFGSQVRETAARLWDLPDLVSDPSEERRLLCREIRRAVVEHWTRGDSASPIASAPPEAVERALARHARLPPSLAGGRAP